MRFTNALGRYLPAFLVCLICATTRLSAAEVDVEAVPGAPFGIGRITLPLDAKATAGLSGVDAFELTERNGRIHYPTRNAGILDRLGEFSEDPSRLTIMFLFTGDQPLELTIYSPERHTVRVEPRGRPRQHQRLLRQWWRQYNAAAQQMVKSGGYPAIADHYLVAMLANRLRLEPTLVGRRLFPSSDAEQGLGLLLGTETLHAAMVSEVMMRQQRRDQPADQPLPAFDYNPLEIPGVPADVPVEKIALHVPQECYYIRFGSFANYRWLRDLTGEFGGDLGNMISARGLDFDQSGRMEQQLALRETTLGNLFGGTAIADVAVIGLDMFSREGAAVGMLFEARNSGVLGNDLNKQRAEAQKKYPTAKMSSVTIAGHTVSLLETPDHAVRSFYAVDGDYHLVTSSRTMVERFYESGAGRGSLGKSNEFRHARHTMPISRNDTIFAYLSDAFLQNLSSPRYRIEMARRVASRVEMDVLAMARYAAKAEGRDYKTVDDLVRGGFLPRDFDRRADAALVTLSETGAASDSIRGARGSFIPVADMTIDRVSSEELATYQAFAANYQSAVGRAEPIMAAIGRRTMTAAELKAAGAARAAARASGKPNEPTPAEPRRASAADNDPTAPPPPPPGTVAGEPPPSKGDAKTADRSADKSPKQKPSGAIEVLTIDARVSPFTGKTYQQVANRVGPATTKFVPALPDNLVTINAVLKSGGFASFFPGVLRADDDSSRLLFIGLNDFTHDVEAGGKGLFDWLNVLKDVNGYFGSWPEAGAISKILGIDESLPEGQVTYHEILLRMGLWALKLNEFTVVALNKESLGENVRQLRIAEATKPAQIRIQVEDLRGTRLEKFLAQLGYRQAWTGSTGNARYLHRLAEQFQIPRADALPLAQDLCGAKLIDPLAGQYKLVKLDSGLETWASSAWKGAGANSVPDGYSAAPLLWFRGLNAEATLEPGTLSIRAELTVERKAGGISLPSFFGQ